MLSQRLHYVVTTLLQRQSLTLPLSCQLTSAKLSVLTSIRAIVQSCDNVVTTSLCLVGGIDVLCLLAYKKLIRLHCRVRKKELVQQAFLLGKVGSATCFAILRLHLTMHLSLLVLRATDFLSTSDRFLLKVCTTGFLYGGQKKPLTIFN